MVVPTKDRLEGAPDEELMEGLPDNLPEPETEEDMLQAMRIAALRAVYRHGGTALLSKIVKDKQIMRIKGGAITAKQLTSVLEVFPNNFLFSKEEAGINIALLGIDVDDVSMLEEAAKKGLLSKVDEHMQEFIPLTASGGGHLNDSLLERLHEAISGALWPSVARVAHLESTWSQAQMATRIAKYVYKAASNPELQSIPWQEGCKQLVSGTMHGYTAACCESNWFIHLDLVPALCAAAAVVLRCPKRPLMQQAVAIEFEDAMDRMMLDKGMWQATRDTFGACGEKVQAKIFHAVSKSYWPALDEILLNLHPQNELRNVEDFARRWINDALCRAWGGVERAEEILTEDAVCDFFLRTVAPFGQDDAYSCIPGVLVEGIGIPPADWPFIHVVVSELLNKWNGGSSTESSKKRRKTEEAYSAFGEQANGASKAGLNGQRSAFKPTGQRVAYGAPVAVKSRGRGAVMIAECEAGRGHPDCTSQEDCIGGPKSRLVQHLVSGREGGDIYCEPCWCTFVRRNPQLQGLFLD